MTIHYHGTPVSPVMALNELAGRCFCVSFAAPSNVAHCHHIGQSVMLDNGAFSQWKRGKATNWPAYYKWVEEWLSYPTTWAVVPDVIDGPEEEQDRLAAEWPFTKESGAPVWHMNESIDRILSLLDYWPRVCIGSTSVYAVVLSEAWERRMDEVWDAIALRHQRVQIHMLRGMACCGRRWPFASVDSTDIARNHHRPQNSPRRMADRWDAVQCPATWKMDLVECLS